MVENMEVDPQTGDPSSAVQELDCLKETDGEDDYSYQSVCRRNVYDTLKHELCLSHEEARKYALENFHVDADTDYEEEDSIRSVKVTARFTPPQGSPDSDPVTIDLDYHLHAAMIIGQYWNFCKLNGEWLYKVEQNPEYERIVRRNALRRKGNAPAGLLEALFGLDGGVSDGEEDECSVSPELEEFKLKRSDVQHIAKKFSPWADYKSTSKGDQKQNVDVETSGAHAPGSSEVPQVDSLSTSSRKGTAYGGEDEVNEQQANWREVVWEEVEREKKDFQTRLFKVLLSGIGIKWSTKAETYLEATSGGGEWLEDNFDEL